MDSPKIPALALRQALACFPSGVAAVCGMVDGAPNGMAASSFVSVSLAPPLVSVCVAHTSTTWPVLRGLSRLGISVLSEDHGPVASTLAAKGGDRFATVQWKAGTDGAVLIRGSSLWLECRIEHEVPAGDHDIVVFRILTVESYPEITPIVFHGSSFRQLAKLG